MRSVAFIGFSNGQVDLKKVRKHWILRISNILSLKFKFHSPHWIIYMKALWNTAKQMQSIILHLFMDLVYVKVIAILEKWYYIMLHGLLNKHIPRGHLSDKRFSIRPLGELKCHSLRENRRQSRWGWKNILIYVQCSLVVKIYKSN